MSDLDDTQLNTIEQPFPTQVLDHKHADVDDDGGDAGEREIQSAIDVQDTEGDFLDNDDDVLNGNGLAEGQFVSNNVNGASQTAENDDDTLNEPADIQDVERGEYDGEVTGEKSNAIDYAAANGDFDDDSELSDLDEEQFKDFDDAAPNGEEPAVFNLPSFRKKKGGVKPDKQKTGRARRSSLSDDDDGKIYSDDEQRPRKDTGPKSRIPPKPEDPEELRKWELDRTMDAAIAPQKKRRKRDEDDLIASMDDEIVQLAEKMRLAAQADAEANASKKIAPAKLRLLPEVSRILRSQALYDSILDNNMLVSMKHWLEPLPDKSLPALNIQKTIFEALQALPIKTEHLRESGVGKVVLFYKKSKKPEAFIQTIANNLISEWSRPIIRKSASHKTKRVRTADYDGPSSVPRLTTSLSQSSPVSQYKSKGGTSIPRGEKAYDVAPRARELSGVQARSDGGEAYKRMKNTLKDLGKRTGKKGGVSIEGRGVA